MWGSIIAAGASLLGGMMASHSSNKATEATQDANNASQALVREQLDFQKEYTKNSIQWRVEDAKKAGLHPMVAAGLSPTSFSPVSYTPTSYQPSDYSWVGDIGQNLNYAATKAKTSKQQGEMLDLQVQGLQLDNEYKRAQIDSLKADTLASTIASDQALRSPAAPDLNGGSNLIGGQNNSPRTGLISPQNSAYHIWDMGDGNFDILMNPDYQTTIGDEFGQVATTLKAIARAKQGVWINPEDRVAYVFDSDTGYFRRLSSLSNEEARRLLGSPSSRSSGVDSSFRERNKYRYR